MRFLAAALPVAALLLSPLAASAQMPPISDTAKLSVPDIQWRKIALRNIAPLDVLKLMHWETVNLDPFKPVQVSQPVDHPTYTKLPDGVNRIFALQSNNSLLLEATEAGYKRVQEIVKTLDIAPQQVKLTVRFVAVPLSQKLTVDLSNPSQALLQMYSAKALFSEPIIETAEDGKSAYFSLPWLHLDQLHEITPSKPPEVPLTPRVNKDNSVTLSLSAKEPTAQVLETIRTVSSGEITVYDATLFLSPSRYRVFLFVMPIALSTGTNGGTINIKP
jgi:hypothetical protein